MRLSGASTLARELNLVEGQNARTATLSVPEPGLRAHGREMKRMWEKNGRRQSLGDTRERSLSIHRAADYPDSSIASGVTMIGGGSRSRAEHDASFERSVPLRQT